MKVHKQKLDTKPANNEAANSCCASEATTEKVNSDPCCEQPTDGTSCCDKTASKKANSETIGCC